MDKILIISSNNTGYGHKSITEALYQQFDKLDKPIQLEEIDAFALGGMFTEFLANLYNKIAVHAPRLWGWVYNISSSFTSLINFFATFNVKRKFLKLIHSVKPDMIVTVHPGFVGSIINILEKKGLNIPVVVIIADFDNVTKLWADKRAQYILCPTKESFNSMIKFGVPEEKLKLFGFPARDRFNHLTPEYMDIPIACTTDNKTLTFLIMNGSQGLGYSSKMAQILLDKFDCHVIILAGNNKKLKASLEKDLLPSYPGRLTVCGFIKNVEYYMTMSDILILRASPNVLTEAINLCKPIIVTGSFTGQEEKNPKFVENNNLGIVCEDIDKLEEAVNTLLDEDGKKLREIYESQIKFRQPNAAKDMVEFIAGLEF